MNVPMFSVLLPWIPLWNFFLFFYCGSKWTQSSDQTKLFSWFPGEIIGNYVIKRWDFFQRHLSLFCILPFFYRPCPVCISWDLAQEENTTPNQQTRRIGKLTTSPTKKQSKFSFPISSTNSFACSGALTPVSHKGLFHSSARSNSLSIQCFGQAHQVSLLPLHSLFLFSMILPSGSFPGLLPFCLAHNQQKGRYITISHQERDSPGWSDFICRASLQGFCLFALHVLFRLKGIPKTKKIVLDGARLFPII